MNLKIDWEYIAAIYNSIRRDRHGTWERLQAGGKR